MPAALRFVAQSLFSALFPADCRLCNTPLANVSVLPVCSECLDSLHPLAGPLCAWCGDRLVPFAREGQICIHCEEAGPHFEHATSFGEYEDVLRGLVHLLKYAAIRPAARPLGRHLATTLRQLVCEFPGEYLVVPVPLHQSRRRDRGFNQAELIAQVALRELHDLPLELSPKVLVRTRATETQTGYTREQRRRNLHGAFKVRDASRVKGRSVLLVDDVLTTGSTADECARVLLRAGAEQVLVATVARAVTLDGVAPATKTRSNRETEEPVSV